MEPAPPALPFTPRERRLVARLRTPLQVQRWLEGLPYNWERRGPSMRTLRGVVRTGEAHCLEAVLSAAAILEQHGRPPLLMDLCSKDGLDHVVLVFRGPDGRFGAVAKSRDPGLHGRKPVYRNLHTLVASYAAPYVDHTGRIHGYGVLDLRTLNGVDWRLSPRNVWAVEKALIRNRHRRFRMSDAAFRYWKARYERFKEAHPEERPTYYRNGRCWL